jgi:hypothetical protein
MPEVEEILDTPVNDDQVVDQNDGGNDGNSGDPAAEQPFLRVNDRTVYKTSEDAVKAFDEAGRRISELTAWQKEAKNWGLNDPKQFTDVARELLQLRQERAEWKKQAETAAKPAADPTQKFVEAGLDPKQAAEVQKYLDKLGYVPAAKLAEIEAKWEEKFGTIQQHTEAETQRYYQNQEATGRAEIGNWLKTANLADESGRRSAIVGSLIKEAIDNDPGLNQQWFNGGPEAMAMVKQLFDEFVKELGWQPTVAAGDPAATTVTNYAAAKKSAVASNKTLPKQGTGARATNASATVARQDPFKAMHDKAYDEFQKALKS